MCHEFGNASAGQSVSKLCKILTNTKIEPAGCFNKIASTLTIGAMSVVYARNK